jgi:hypothetical protein
VSPKVRLQVILIQDCKENGENIGDPLSIRKDFVAQSGNVVVETYGSETLK